MLACSEGCPVCNVWPGSSTSCLRAAPDLFLTVPSSCAMPELSMRAATTCSEQIALPMTAACCRQSCKAGASHQAERICTAAALHTPKHAPRPSAIACNQHNDLCAAIPANVDQQMRFASGKEAQHTVRSFSSHLLQAGRTGTPGILLCRGRCSSRSCGGSSCWRSMQVCAGMYS